MALILYIDTATEEALVGLQQNGNSLSVLRNHNQKEHATFLHLTIETLLQKENLSVADLQAVAVVSGPGSYTGLRVGMATAKGLCFSLQIPLIGITSLQLLAKAAQLKTKNNSFLYCPMIDARRMEVFTAVYDHQQNELLHPIAQVLHEKSYSDFLAKNDLYFFGNGSFKWKEICLNKNAHFLTDLPVNEAYSTLAEIAFEQNNFISLALSEPYYIKPFYNGQ